jgi:hypothetical protein
MALDCGANPYFWIYHRGDFVGRGKERTKELTMGFFNWLGKFLSYDPSVYRPPANEKSKPQMNQGDFHSGPEGYSPNTAYPDTFYGSGGSSSDMGGHDEGDFNR